MSKIVKMEQPKITKWKIELLEESEKVYCGEKMPSLNVKELYIKSWSVEEERKSFFRLHRQARAISKIVLSALTSQKEVINAIIEKAKESKNEGIEEISNIEKVKTMEELMEEAKVAVEANANFFNLYHNIEEIVTIFKTLFSEMSCKVIFADEQMQYPVSIDELFNGTFKWQDILYLCSAYYTLFLEDILEVKRR
jgi:hypothetical protein